MNNPRWLGPSFFIVASFAPVTGAQARVGSSLSRPAGTPGGYADELTDLSPPARDFDRQPGAVFSYCARNTATYECLSYGPDGAVRRQRTKAVLHGTAFAFKRQGPDTFLLTNDHVASWPEVTDHQHTVPGIGPGCKKISESLSLVDDEHDAYATDDVPVSLVITDPRLDVAVLKTHAELQVMPWKIGHSGSLRERNVVEVRGFPLGAFRATNIGKVISPHDHDDFGDWDHDDFVIDALLSSGNSGSPVLAVSSVTGEYELVGVFHAGYTEGSALNVVVGIDQIRDLMTTLKSPPRAPRGDAVSLDRSTRDIVAASLNAEREIFFGFGSRVALARQGVGGELFFAVFPKDFPAASEPDLIIEDGTAPDAAAFGEVGRLWVGSARGLKSYPQSALNAEVRGQVERLLNALRADAYSHAVYQSALRLQSTSRQSSDRMAQMAKRLAQTATGRTDLIQIVSELSDNLAPSAGESATTLALVTAPSSLVPPAPPAPVTVAVTLHRPSSDAPATLASALAPVTPKTVAISSAAH
ncbi:MAG TPA: S1C family serine protease [Polyangia bacterium]|jgi:serine protease Do